MNDRKLIRKATEDCAAESGRNRAERRQLASKARAIIASDAAMARALDKSDADLGRAEAVALLAMVRMKRMIDSGQATRAKAERHAIRAELETAQAEAVAQ
jgi:hypothetical protein